MGHIHPLCRRHLSCFNDIILTGFDSKTSHIEFFSPVWSNVYPSSKHHSLIVLVWINSVIIFLFFVSNLGAPFITCAKFHDDIKYWNCIEKNNKRKFLLMTWQSIWNSQRVILGDSCIITFRHCVHSHTLILQSLFFLWHRYSLSLSLLFSQLLEHIKVTE